MPHKFQMRVTALAVDLFQPVHVVAEGAVQVRGMVVMRVGIVVSRQRSQILIIPMTLAAALLLNRLFGPFSMAVVTGQPAPYMDFGGIVLTPFLICLALRKAPEPHNSHSPERNQQQRHKQAAHPP